MKWVLYNILFALVYPFLLPGFLIRMIRRGGYAARMGDRFGLYPPEIVSRFIPDGKPCCPHQASTSRVPSSDFVWIHAVSVGEVQVAGQLMRAWRAVEPSVRFCFSTTSSTGWKMAEREVKKVGGESRWTKDGDVLIYNPLDFPSFVKSALRLVRPRAIVLTESEIWPVFIRKAKKYGIPLFLINARVSDRSAPRYRAAKFFFKDVFGCFTRIFAQSETDKARLVAAGAPAERVEVTGSFKFDVAKRNEAKEKELRAWIYDAASRRVLRGKILLGGSTWPGEDVALLKIYGRLLEGQQASGNKLNAGGVRPILVLAPRHFEKADQVEANIRAAGFDCVRRSRSERARDTSRETRTEAKRLETERPPVFLCDTTGEMMGLFGICDVAFVGKSLCAHGSQNMIEPCLCGKPTVVGPYTENFRPVMNDLLAAQAVVQVPDEAALEKEIVRLMTDDAAAQELGARATAAVLKRQGVVPRCVETIRSLIGGDGKNTTRERKEWSE